MYTDVFCANAQVINIAAATVHSKPIDLFHVIEETCTAQLPKLERDVETFQKNLQLCVTDFEQKMDLFGFAVSESGDVKSLVQYVQSLPTKYAEAR